MDTPPPSLNGPPSGFRPAFYRELSSSSSSAATPKSRKFGTSTSGTVTTNNLNHHLGGLFQRLTTPDGFHSDDPNTGAVDGAGGKKSGSQRRRRRWQHRSVSPRPRPPPTPSPRRVTPPDLPSGHLSSKTQRLHHKTSDDSSHKSSLGSSCPSPKLSFESRHSHKLSSDSCASPPGLCHIHKLSTDSCSSYKLSTDSCPSHKLSTDSSPSHKLSTDSCPSHKLSTDSCPSFALSDDSCPSPHRMSMGSSPSHKLSTDSCYSHKISTDSCYSHKLSGNSFYGLKSSDDSCPIHNCSTHYCPAHRLSTDSRTEDTKATSDTGNTTSYSLSPSDLSRGFSRQDSSTLHHSMLRRRCQSQLPPPETKRWRPQYFSSSGTDFVPDLAVKLLVLGGRQVGKSALTVRYLTKRYIGEYQSHSGKAKGTTNTTF